MPDYATQALYAATNVSLQKLLSLHKSGVGVQSYKTDDS